MKFRKSKIEKRAEENKKTNDHLKASWRAQDEQDTKGWVNYDGTGRTTSNRRHDKD